MTIRAIPVDLHQHLQTNPDVSKVSFNGVINRIRKAYGEYCIVGLNNFRDTNSRGLRNDTRYEDFIWLPGYERQKYDDHITVGGVRIVKVQEIPTLYKGKEVHVLCAGLKEREHIEPRRDLLDVLQEIKKRKLISILDHPFSRAGAGEFLVQDPALERKVLSSVTALEVYNGLAAKSFPLVSDGKSNEKAEIYFQAVKESYPSLGAIVGTDGQSLDALDNGSYSVVEIPIEGRDADHNLIANLREALTKHRDTQNDRKIAQSRWATINHIAGILWEGGIIHTLKRL